MIRKLTFRAGCALLLAAAAAWGDDLDHLTARVASLESEMEALRTLQDSLDRRVPKGMLLPFFGDRLPEGYVWADGKTAWPAEDWVPAHLRGQPVPDMRKAIVGGASDFAATEVGSTGGAGVVHMPKQSVPGSDFKVSAPQVSPKHLADPNNAMTMVDTDARLTPGAGPIPFIICNRDEFNQGRTTVLSGYSTSNTGAVCMNFFKSFPVRTATYDYPDFSGPISGQHDIPALDVPLTADSLPPHAISKWIIRVK